MKRVVIGIDTSNYRTSAAAVTEDGEILLNDRELLPVPAGERGLRQSEAVFAHIRRFSSLEASIRRISASHPMAAVIATDRPCDGEASYMPVFVVGTTIGKMMAAAAGVPFFTTTHQRSHLAAAAAGTELADRGEMMAMHLSGGTTDMLLLRGDEVRRIGGSEDLHAGQLVDRAGVAMGLPFPSGPALEKLAGAGISRGRLGCSMEKGDLRCHLSGAETQVSRWIRDGAMPEADIAREIYDLLARTFSRMAAAGARETGLDRILITGGIASSALFRDLLTERLGKTRNAPKAVFGSSELSGDNAVGTARIGFQKLTAAEQQPEMN